MAAPADHRPGLGSDAGNILPSGAPVTGGWDNYPHGRASFVMAHMKEEPGNTPHAPRPAPGR
ncbi:hypothetical protein ABZ401_12670 [Streptomyces sp. NPDC005892]|uniref:hypothetical protein n=1 Tax=Streptomyces sp. NPDC005892 TaxID=3155593 RepID=UPI0033F244D1